MGEPSGRLALLIRLRVRYTPVDDTT